MVLSVESFLSTLCSLTDFNMGGYLDPSGSRESKVVFPPLCINWSPPQPLLSNFLRETNNTSRPQAGPGQAMATASLGMVAPVVSALRH
jgi:hypothetical protein